MSGSTWTILCMVIVYVLVSQSRLVHCLDTQIDTENGQLQNDGKEQELNKAQVIKNVYFWIDSILRP